MLTREKLQKLNELTGAVDSLKELSSELLRTAQDRFNHRLQKIEREGKEIEVKEKVLWDEVWHLGDNCPAGRVLAGLHPEVFEKFVELDKASEELKKFCIVELGVDYTQMTLKNYLDLTKDMFELLLSEQKQN